MYLFLVIILFLFILTFAYAGLRGAPWVPTWKSDVERFLRLAKIKPGQKVYDLGCGDGRLICAAAKKGAKAEGLEISLLPYLAAKIRVLFLKERKNCKIRYKDFWHANLSDADIVYFFLMDKIYPKLKSKLEKELKSGTKVIAYVWPIKGWKLIKIDTAKNKPKIFLYQI